MKTSLIAVLVVSCAPIIFVIWCLVIPVVLSLIGAAWPGEHVRLAAVIMTIIVYFAALIGHDA